MKLKHLLFSGILLGLLLLPCLCSAQTLYEEDFESYAVGATSIGLDQFNGTISGGDSNHYAAFSHYQTMKPYFSSTKGLVTVSVDVMMTKVGSARVICLWDAADTLRSGRLHVNNGSFVLTRSDGKNTTLAPVEANTWYNIVMDLDYTAQEITQVYINGKAMLNAPAEFFNHDQTVSNVAAAYFCLDADDGLLCIDNIKIEENRYPELNEAFNSAKGLLHLTCGTEAGSYPSSSFTMLSDVIEEAEKAMNSDGFSEGEAGLLTAKLNTAVKVFEESVIQGGVSYIYENDFERYAVNSSPTGFLVASNTKIESQGGSQRAHLTGQGRLLYSHAPTVTTDLVLTMRFMQPEKNAIPYLFCTSGKNGSNALMKIFSDGTDLLVQKSTGTEVVLANYQAGTWYGLKAEFYLEDRAYVLSYAIENGDWVEIGRFDFWMNDTSIERFFDVRYTNGNGTNNIYVDDFTAAPITTVSVANDVNSVAISGAPAYLTADGEAWLTAAVYDKFYKLWSDQSVVWSTSEGLSIEADGRLTVESGFEGKARVMAQTLSGIYEAAEVICLPQSAITDAKATLLNGKLTVSGIFNIGKYMVSQIAVSVSGEKTGQVATTTANVADNGTGRFTVTVTLPEDMDTQLLTVTLTDVAYGATATVQCRIYGADADETFVKELNRLLQEQQSVTALLEEYKDACALQLDDLYTTHKDEYNTKILAHAAFADAAACRDYINELNVLLGIRYAVRSDIEAVMQNALMLLKQNGLSEDFDALSSTSNYETFLLHMMGYEADDMAALISQMNSEIKTLTQKSSTGSSSGGGGSAPKRTNTGATAAETVNVTKSETIANGSASSDEKSVFFDITQAEWAAEAIKKLNDKQIMVGDGGYVYPNRSVTRAEFAKLLKQTFNIVSADTAPSFADFNDSAWWAESVKTIAAAGIINGYEDGSFKPDTAVTREEAAVMLARVIEKCNLTPYTKDLSGGFSDDASVSDYAKEAVSIMRKYGIMSGQGNNSFVPQANVTRAEAAVMLVNMLSFNTAE